MKEKEMRVAVRIPGRLSKELREKARADSNPISATIRPTAQHCTRR